VGAKSASSGLQSGYHWARGSAVVYCGHQNHVLAHCADLGAGVYHDDDVVHARGYRPGLGSSSDGDAAFNQVIVGLALFLTLFIMTPVWEQIQVRALDPYLQDQISQEHALEQAIGPIRTFMLKQVREKDLELFVNLARVEIPEGPEQTPLRILIPAFVTSELRTAFQIGFLIFIPFLVIDMIVASHGDDVTASHYDLPAI